MPTPRKSLQCSISKAKQKRIFIFRCLGEVHPILTRSCGLFPARCSSPSSHTRAGSTHRHTRLLPAAIPAARGHEQHPHLPPPQPGVHPALPESSWERELSLLPLPGQPRTSHLLRKGSRILLAALGSGRCRPSARGLPQAAPVTVLPPRFCVFPHCPGPARTGVEGPPRRGEAWPRQRRPRRCLPPPPQLPSTPDTTDSTVRVPTRC